MPRKKVEQKTRTVVTVEVAGPPNEVDGSINSALVVLRQCGPNCKVRATFIREEVVTPLPTRTRTRKSTSPFPPAGNSNAD